MTEFTIRDPFAGHITVNGETLEKAIAAAYADIPPVERPTHVWFEEREIPVPGGMARPIQ